MRSKKALVLLLSASMVFTMNNMTFAKTKTASYVSLQSEPYVVEDRNSDSIELKSSSLNEQSENDWEIKLRSSTVKIQSENVKKLAELNKKITLHSSYKNIIDSELTELTTDHPELDYGEGMKVKSYSIRFATDDVEDMNMKVYVSIAGDDLKDFNKITAWTTTGNEYSSLGDDKFGFESGKIELKAVGTGTYLFVCSNTSEEPTKEPEPTPTPKPTPEPTPTPKPTPEPTPEPKPTPDPKPTPLDNTVSPNKPTPSDNTVSPNKPTPSDNTVSPNKPEEPKTVSEDDVEIPEDKTKPAVIDASESNTAEIPTDVLEKAKENESTEVKIKDAVLTLPQSVVNQLLDYFNGSDIAISLAKETISAEEAAEKYGIVTDKPMEVINITIENFHESFAEPITVAFVVNEDTMELGTGFMYCTSVEPIEFIGSDDVTDGEFTATLKHFSEFVISEEAEANGKYSGSFATTGMRLYATYSGNEYYTSNGVEVIFADGTEEKKLATDAAAGFKVTAPYAAAGGYKVVKWIPLEDGELVQEYPAIAPGATAALPTLIDGSEVNVNYYPVVESLSNVSSNTISANGHTVTIEYDKTPAFTGKKLTLADLDLAVTIDGSRIDNSLVKIKTKGKKTVGSDVTITLKTIKGLDKVTNKELKNKEIGVAKIRPIQAVYTGLYSKQWSGSEGKVMVSMKGDTVKKVTVEVNSHKVKTGVGYTAKKVVVNKKSYSYDSATKMITFDGTVLTGKVKVRLASK